MDFEPPPGLRIGQFLFSFLEWLKEEKKIDGEQSSYMADPFFIEDAKLMAYYDEFKKKYGQGS